MLSRFDTRLMGLSATRTVARRLVSFACVAAMLTQYLLPLPAIDALTSTTIVIDADLGDWVGVRADPDNVAVDTQVPMDPDYPGQPDRDIYYVNATYDSEYLYLSWRRTAGGTKAITLGAYIDLNGDGLLQDTDRVVMWTLADPSPLTIQPQNYRSPGAILHYRQARDGTTGPKLYPAGDPMGGDGETPDGWARWQDGQDIPAKPMDAYMEPISGIEAEARVAWTDLGFSPSTPIPPPIAIHFASGNGESWGNPGKPSNTRRWVSGQHLENDRGQVEDNVGELYWLLQRSVSVTPNGTSGVAAGSVATYTHTIKNTSNVTDTFNLSATSSNGWTTSITTVGGTPLSALSLAAQETTTVVVRVTVPGGAPSGTRDTTTVRATSQTKPSVTSAATDTTYVGAVTVTPDRTGAMAPGQTIVYTHTVINNTGSAAVFDLSGTSSMGWPVTVTDAGGAPLTSVSLSADATATVQVRVQVPAGATIGSQDVTRLRATLQGDPSTFGEAADTTTVLSSLNISPNRSGVSGAGAVASYQHTVQNSWPTTRTISLSGLSSKGWPVTIYDSDGVTPITLLTLGPNGASRDVIVRITIPSSATTADTDVTTVTVTAGAATSSVTDTTVIRRLATYDSGGYANQVNRFVLGQKIFARGTGFSTSSDVYFVWKDPSGATVRTTPSLRVDTQGMAFDDYTTNASSRIGIWTVEVRNASGGALLETHNFTVTFDGSITALSATDAATVGASTQVTSTLSNRNAVAIPDSTVTYLIWWDSNGDGTFGAGDIYMNPSGNPQTYGGSGSVSSKVTTGVAVAAGGTWSDPGWSMSNANFPNQGTYRVSAVWTDSVGTVIDQKTTEFYSIPTLGWPLFLAFVLLALILLWRRSGSERLLPVRALPSRGWPQ